MTNTNPTNQIQSASFRDPSGFVFIYGDKLYRQVNRSYREHYELLMNSGLYQKLVEKKLLIPHKEVSEPKSADVSAYKIIRPEPVPFISYPYEWCFSQYQDAAIATLAIQQAALKRGLTLKDASAYNIQFTGGRPVLIDTLSFERHRVGEPWVAYRQFCQHFLAPLALMSYTDIRLGQLMRVHLDGIPLDLTSRLLPRRTYARFSLLAHIHLHARGQRHYSDKSGGARKATIDKRSLIALVDNLAAITRKLKLKSDKTEWGDYYDATNYSDAAFKHKRELISAWLKQARPDTVFDLGANTGEFSRLAADTGIFTVAGDIDPLAVEKNYLNVRKHKNHRLLPLLLDLANPSPALGWASRERMSFAERGPAGLVMALALIHHLAISNNLPFRLVAEYFRSLAPRLLIEFVPKEDSNTQRLLATRQDIFNEYDRQHFEDAFKKYYRIIKYEKIMDSERTLYYMEEKK